MNDGGSFVMLSNLFDQLAKIADDTQALVWAVRRSMIAQSVLIALVGMTTLFNLWLLRRVMKVVREIIDLVKELVDKETR
jgi:hypothetical protein